MGEIDVLRSDEYVNLPGCLDKVDIPKDQLNAILPMRSSRVQESYRCHRHECRVSPSPS